MKSDILAPNLFVLRSLRIRLSENMLFNSIDFAIFLPIVFILYWFVTNKSLKLQNFLIVAASYLFYGWWDWRFLSLILFSTFVDYSIGLGLSKQESPAKRKILLWTSILVNLGFLGFFKYYNFFLDNFTTAFTFFGTEIKANSLDIILPVGISFYTFQTLSYSIDVYRRKLAPTKDFIAFSAFVSFFPQLVAGPIERATHLLPQFYNKRTFEYSKAVDGMRQILWGLFKKIVIADSCAEYANLIFNNSAELNGSTLVLGALFFTFQIYGDFSGYSDIAIGTSRLFGFDLMRNFNFPYFSRDIAEFWRRWHISLSTWFRDYLYIPLGGSRGGTLTKVRNTFIIFIVSGFWHGANWTFIAWGALNAIYFLPLLLTNNNRNNIDIVAQGKNYPSIKELSMMTATFGLTVFAWIFFRANNIGHAIQYISEIFSPSIFSVPIFTDMARALITMILVAIFMLVEWKGREGQYAIAHLGIKWKWPIRYALYYSIIIVIFLFGGKEQQFIYFQF
ncbi:MAG: MBOAT family O-acyltransferase [Flavisolibacter sp.]